MNRASRRSLERATQGGGPLSIRQAAGIQTGTEATAEEEKAALEALWESEGAESLAPAISMSVLAHTWYNVAQHREANRLTQQRFLRLQKPGSAPQMDNVLRQFRDATEELSMVENQIKDLLQEILASDGLETVKGLLGAQHHSFVSEVSVRLPAQLQIKLLVESGIVTMATGEEGSGEEEPARRVGATG